MASLTQWTWVWVNSRGWWLTVRSGVLQSIESHRAAQDWVTKLNWKEDDRYLMMYVICPGCFSDLRSCSSGPHSPYSSHTGPWLIPKHARPRPSLTTTTAPSLPPEVYTNERKSEKSPPTHPSVSVPFLIFFMAQRTNVSSHLISIIFPTVDSFPASLLISRGGKELSSEMCPETMLLPHVPLFLECL